MNFKQAEQYLLKLASLPRREYMTDSRHCGIYLKRLQFLLDIIGNPEKQIPHYIHITGTSGKGSICLMLHSILKSSNKKTGLSISPHYSCVTERWQINGKEMTKLEFTNLVNFIKPKITEYLKKSTYELPSYFEILEAIGLLYFAQKKVAWAIMEVGLGGRYDASNIIPHKDVAVITNIGLDHEKLIGPTKAKIAYEKAGIIKRGCRVFTAEQDKKILTIIQKEANKYLTNIKQILNKYYLIDSSIQGINFKYQNQTYTLPCLGEHQINNAILAIEIAKYLKISNKQIQAGLTKVKLPLRMEVIQKNPLIILDGAHNPDKMKTTVNTVCKYLSAQVNKCKKNTLTHLHTYTPTHLHLLVGFSADKNIAKMTKQLATLNPNTIAITKNTINSFREAAKPELIAQGFKKLLPKTKIKIFLDPPSALEWSKKQNKKNDCLLVTGSIFLSGQLRPLLHKN